MDLNVVVLAGRLAAEPEIRTFAGGASLVRYLLTVRSDEPRRRVDVLPVTLWNPARDLLERPFPPGTSLWAAGSAQRRFWASATGRVSAIELVAHHVERADDGAGEDENGG